MGTTALESVLRWRQGRYSVVGVCLLGVASACGAVTSPVGFKAGPSTAVHAEPHAPAGDPVAPSAATASASRDSTRVQSATEGGASAANSEAVLPVLPMKATELFSTLEAQRVGVAAEPVPPGDGSAPSESEGWPEYCRQLVQYAPDRAFESCAVRLLGNGSTVVVSIVGECGGDSCSVEGWVYTEVLGRFVAMPGDIGGTLAADPSGQFLLIDQATELSIPHPEDVELRDPLGGNDEIITARIDLPSMKVTPFAACFSPALSPGGRWFVCRNRVGDVLRFAVTGGKPKRIVKAGVPKDKLRWVPYAYGHPDAVEFPSATLLRYTLELETLKTHEVPWSE